jgi:hypothetical protein
MTLADSTAAVCAFLNLPQGASSFEQLIDLADR